MLRYHPARSNSDQSYSRRMNRRGRVPSYNASRQEKKFHFDSPNGEVPGSVSCMTYDSSVKVRHGSSAVRPCSWKMVDEPAFHRQPSSASEYAGGDGLHKPSRPTRARTISGDGVVPYAVRDRRGLQTDGRRRNVLDACNCAARRKFQEAERRALREFEQRYDKASTRASAEGVGALGG